MEVDRAAHAKASSQRSMERSHCATLKGMMWILSSGSPWRDLPERDGSWKSVCDRFRRWTADGVIDDTILERLRLVIGMEARTPSRPKTPRLAMCGAFATHMARRTDIFTRLCLTGRNDQQETGLRGHKHGFEIDIYDQNDSSNTAYPTNGY